jgi:hypothetical protein
MVPLLNVLQTSFRPNHSVMQHALERVKRPFGVSQD